MKLVHLTKRSDSSGWCLWWDWPWNSKLCVYYDTYTGGKWTRSSLVYEGQQATNLESKCRPTSNWNVTASLRNHVMKEGKEAILSRLT